MPISLASSLEGLVTCCLSLVAGAGPGDRALGGPGRSPAHPHAPLGSDRRDGQRAPGQLPDGARHMGNSDGTRHIVSTPRLTAPAGS